MPARVIKKSTKLIPEIAVVKFVPYDPAIHKDDFLTLNIEYISWIGETMLELSKKYGIDIASILDTTAEDYAEGHLEQYGSIKPPDGIVYIVEVDGKAEGMGGLQRLDANIAEIKRMFIRSKCRGKGLGRELFKRLVEKGKEFGYDRIRLETGTYMKIAHEIYRSEGFREIEQYEGHETPEPFLPFTLFMEKKL